MKQLFADPAPRPGRNYLTDQRELLSPGTTSLVEYSIELLRRKPKILGPFRCAIVVRRELSYGMGRMAERLAYGSEVEVKTFVALEEAGKWLAR